MTEKIYGTLVVYGADVPRAHYPVTNIFDIDGDETDDIEAASRAVVKVADDKWLVFDIDATGIWPVQ